MNKTELARSLFDAFLSGDRERAEALLAADFTFSSPYDDAIDRASYFERCWPNRDAVRAIRIRSVAENESDAFVAYECETTGGGKFENVERFCFLGEQIRSVQVFFGDPPSGHSKESWRRRALTGE